MTKMTSSPCATVYTVSLNGSPSSPALLTTPPNWLVNGSKPNGPPVPVKVLESPDAYRLAVCRRRMGVPDIFGPIERYARAALPVED